MEKRKHYFHPKEKKMDDNQKAIIQSTLDEYVKHWQTNLKDWRNSIRVWRYHDYVPDKQLMEITNSLARKGVDLPKSDLRVIVLERLHKIKGKSYGKNRNRRG